MDAENQSGPVIVRTSDVLGGRPVFRGTRVQAEILFENLANGHTIDELVDSFPTLDPDDLRLALLQACEALKAAAPDVSVLEWRERRLADVS